MESKTSTAGGIGELVKTIVYALLLAGVIRTLFFQPFWIPSGSMKPTLLIGDFLFVNKMAYGYSKHSCPFSICPFSGRILGSEPERGDVIVFKHPTNGTDYVKRLVGLPGETIQIKDGILHIDGKAAPQMPLEIFVEEFGPQGPLQRPPRCKTRVQTPGAECQKDQAIETLPGGLEHKVLDFYNSEGDSTRALVVPEGHYFFMGDNRDNSLDSRFSQTRGGVGFVPYENLIGRADRVIFSSGGSSMLSIWAWRPDRFFKAVE